MSSPAPHLDVDALADLLAGEGTAAQTAHLEGCPACGAALVDLDAALVPVAAELAAAAAVPLPPVPADLEDRLRALLRDEPPPAAAPAEERVPLRAVPVGETGPASARSTTVVPARGQRGAPRVLGAAAGVVAVLAVVGLGLLLGRGGGGSTASSAGGASASTATAALPPLPVSGTGTDYGRDAAALQTALPGLLTAPAVPAPAAAGPAADSAPAAADPLARLRDPAALQACLTALAPPGDQTRPLALDYARWKGAPALVVVLPSARAGKVDAFVVGAGCRAGADQTLAFLRLDRP